MATIEVTQFGPQVAIDTESSLAKAVERLQGVKTAQHFVIGAKIQEKGAIQINSSCPDTPDNTNASASPESISFKTAMRSIFGEPRNSFHIALDKSPFGSEGIATAPVVEYVQTYFPASLITPSFQRKIEDDFKKFDEIFSVGVTGDVGYVVGWVVEEQEHQSIDGEKAR